MNGGPLFPLFLTGPPEPSEGGLWGSSCASLSAQCHVAAGLVAAAQGVVLEGVVEPYWAAAAVRRQTASVRRPPLQGGPRRGGPRRGGVVGALGSSADLLQVP